MLLSELPPSMIRGFAFLFGALWGSFFNVAIYRWPLGMSVVRPASRCPSCGTPVPAFRNVPILAYALQRGRAACCGVKLSPRYLLMEVVSGVLCLAVFERFVIQPGALSAEDFAGALALFFFVGGLLVATFIDLEHTIIPDEVTLPGTALGLVTIAWRTGDGLTPMDAAIGAGFGYLLIQLLFVWGYEAAFGRRGMGEGDSKLLMMIGAFCGWKGVLFAILAGCVQGVVVIVAGAILRRDLTAGDEFAHDAPPHNEHGPMFAGVRDAASEPTRLLDAPQAAASDVPAETAAGLTVARAFAVSVLFFGGAYLAQQFIQDLALANLAAAILVAGGVTMLVLYALEGIRARSIADTVEEADDEARHEGDEASGGVFVPPKIPFGPFLALSALEWLFFGEHIIEWWFSLL